MNLFKKIIKKNISDKLFYKILFKKSHGYIFDINRPNTLNEKIQWLKLNDRTKLHTICADKYLVRDYVKKKIGEKYLIDLLLFTRNTDDINKILISKLTPCIIKTNHNSSGGIIVKKGDILDWKANQKWLKKQLKINYYQESREWQYKNIEPGIIVERLLQTSSGKIPSDIKIHCFNGIPKMIQVDLDRGTNNYSRNWYNTDWSVAPFGWYSEDNGIVKRSKGRQLPKPTNLEKMLNLSKELSEEFYYSRIDWYDVNGKLYFGEITFHHDSGMRPIEPFEWDLKLGKELIIDSLKN